MATEYDNTNRGSIWKNDKKETDSHPDYTGSLNVDGIEFWVSAWRRKEGAGEKAPALSFSVRMKESKTDGKQEKPKAKEPAKSTNFDDFDDDIPF